MGDLNLVIGKTFETAKRPTCLIFVDRDAANSVRATSIKDGMDNGLGDAVSAS